MIRLQLPFGAGYAGRLAASGKAALGEVYDSVAGLAALFEDRPELVPTDSNLGEWAGEQLALFDEKQITSEANPLVLLASGFQFDYLAEAAQDIASELDKSDSARAALNRFISACEAVPEWGPEHEIVTVKTAERDIEVMVMGEPEDVQRILPRLRVAKSLDELTEIAESFQRELAEQYNWYRCDETECCGKPGYLVPEVSALSEDKLGLLAVAHVFARPSDEPPAPPIGMQIMVMGDLGSAPNIQDLLRGLFGGGFPDGEDPFDDEEEDDDDRGF